MKIFPPNQFWIEEDVDQEMMDYIWSQIKLANKDHKWALVGHITSSLKLPDTDRKLSSWVEEVAKELDYIYQPTFAVRDLWVNFQKKYEFNPLHNHPSAISFVIWVQIPYSFEDECNTSLAKGYSNNSGCFEFAYTTLLGNISKYCYPPTQGKLLVFPSSMPHQVYPFYTSDLERVSISGNIN